MLCGGLALCRHPRSCNGGQLYCYVVGWHCVGIPGLAMAGSCNAMWWAGTVQGSQVLQWRAAVMLCGGLAHCRHPRSCNGGQL